MKKIFYIFSMVIALFLVGCSSTEESTRPPVPGENTSAAVTGIQAVNDLGKVIDEVTEYQAIAYPKDYSHSNIYIKAVYSDQTTKDVTAFATFSKVDLTKVGKVIVKVTYHSFETSYTLNIIENRINHISLNTSLTKLIYNVGERFSSSGLVVKARYLDGAVSVIDNYSIRITDRNNQQLDTKYAFTVPGDYDVEIASDGVKNFYQIVVYDTSYTIQNSFNITNYAQNIDFSVDGTYNFSEQTTIYKDNTSVLQLQNTILRNKYPDGRSIYQSYNGISYTSALELTAQQDVKLTLLKPAELVLYVGGINGRGVIFSQEDFAYSAIGNVNENVSMLYINLAAGTYDMTTNIDALYVYNIIFNYADDDSPTLSGIRIDSSTVKRSYELNESLETNELKLYAIYSGDREKEIPLSDVEFSLSLNGKEKTALDETGTYIVKVQYGIFDASYEITVTETKIYKTLLLDTTEAKLDFVGETFSYEKVKIYGIISDEKKEELSLEDFAFSLIYEEKIVTDFTVAGEYKVRISYIGFHTIEGSTTLNYTVNYTA